MKHKNKSSLPKQIKVISKEEGLPKSSLLARAVSWVGRQNVFLVIGVISCLIFLGHKSISGFIAEPKPVSEPILRTLPSPSPEFTVKPSIFPSPSPYKRPLPTPTPLPTINTDPLVKCSFSELCGGAQVEMKRSECRSKVCCPVEANKYEIKGQAECDQITSTRFNKAWEDYMRRLEEYELQVSQREALLQQQEQDSLQEQEALRNQLLEDCRNQAREMYKQPFMGSSLDGGGYVVGESPLIRDQLNKALSRCLELFG